MKILNLAGVILVIALVLAGARIAFLLDEARKVAETQSQLGTSIPTISPLMYYGGGTSGARLVSPSTTLLVGDTSTTTNAAIETPSLAITSLTGLDCVGTDGSGLLQAGNCSGGTAGAFSSSSPWTAGNLVYVKGNALLTSVGTTTLVAGTNISFSGGTPVVIGSSPITINATGGGSSFDYPFTNNATSTTLTLSGGIVSNASTTIGTLHLPLSNGGLAVYGGTVVSYATTTAGTGLTYSAGAFNVNTTQSISRLSNLTSNGFVKTGSANGTLSIDTTSYVPTTRTLTTTYPIQGGGDLSANRTFSLAFGTTTANSWSALQQFNGNASTSQLTVSGNLYTAITGSTQCLHVNSAGLVSGTGSDCGTSSGGITSIGPAGQLQTGATQTLASSTGSFNGLTIGTTIVGSGNTITFTPSLSGTLGVAGGGTGSTTLTGLLLGNGTSAVQTYGGNSCPNSFVYSISANGTLGCLGVTTSLIDPGTANQILVTNSIGSSAAWSSDITVSNATTSTSLAIPAAAAPNLGGQGRIALDTTSNNLVVASSTTGSYVAAAATSTRAWFAIASTSPNFISGGTIDIESNPLPEVITGVVCHVEGGTSVVVNISSRAGTSDSNTFTCTTTSSQYAITSNNSFAAYAGWRVELGTITGSVNRLHLRFLGYQKSD